MKKLPVLALIAVLLFLALPISNLIVGLPVTGIAEARTGDPERDAACRVLGTKCVNCHTAEYELPFYAKLPVARGIIEADIEKGTAWLDYGAALMPEGGGPVPEDALAKTEYVLEAGSMPPVKYLLLHWNGGLSGEEREQVLAFVRKHRAEHYATGLAAPAHAFLPIQPLAPAEATDPEKVVLGRDLFHDVRLSVDGTLSCASCHDLGKGGCDQLRYSEGVGGAMGGINSPTVFNARFGLAQFWDGRAADLAEQAAGPVENPIEMGAKWPEVVENLRGDAGLVDRFKALYPDGLTKANILDAIATFEETLVTPDSAVDRYLKGEEEALGADAKAGLELFLEKGCAGCHVGQALGGRSFEKMGRAEDYFAGRGELTEADAGRFGVTKKESDRGKFKVPTLRNVALTFPWLHDGTQTDLAEVVRIMLACELGDSATDAEVAQIVAFLEALTGCYGGELLR